MPDLLESADAGRRNRAVAAPASAALRPATLVGPKKVDQAPVLLFEQVSKWHGPVIGINQVTLELRPGITGLVGHNGCGKTTLLRLAAGQIRPDLGRVTIAGQDAWSAAGKLHVGYCPELDVFYEEMSGRRFVETMARLCGYSRTEARRRGEKMLELVGMADRADRPLAGYSKGMRQRIKLAQALLHDPELLLLDEPLSGIDPIGRRESIALFQELARRGKCLLISSHELDELDKLTDHIAIMAAGRIAAIGTLAKIRAVLDDHPLTIRLACDDNRQLATLLLDLPEVVGLDRGREDCLFVRARQPQHFFQRLNHLVIEENLDLRCLEPMDESTGDVLTYLLGAKP